MTWVLLIRSQPTKERETTSKIDTLYNKAIAEEIASSCHGSMAWKYNWNCQLQKLLWFVNNKSMAICTNKNDESNYVSKENGIEKRGTSIKEGFIQPRERDFICRHNSVNGILDISGTFTTKKTRWFLICQDTLYGMTLFEITGIYQYARPQNKNRVPRFTQIVQAPIFQINPSMCLPGMWDIS